MSVISYQTLTDSESHRDLHKIGCICSRPFLFKMKLEQRDYFLTFTVPYTLMSVITQTNLLIKRTKMGVIENSTVICQYTKHATYWRKCNILFQCK